MQPLAPIQSLAPRSASVARPRAKPGLVHAVAKRPRAALTVAQRQDALRAYILPNLAAARRQVTSWQGPVTLEQVLSLLPPKEAAKIRASRNRALLDFLLAWGRSLRQQAALAKVAQKRAWAQAIEAKHQQTVLDGQRVAAHRAEVTYAASAPTTPLAGLGLIIGGYNQPVAEALMPPILSGFSLRQRTPQLSWA